MNTNSIILNISKQIAYWVWYRIKITMQCHHILYTWLKPCGGKDDRKFALRKRHNDLLGHILLQDFLIKKMFLIWSLFCQFSFCKIATVILLQNGNWSSRPCFVRRNCRLFKTHILRQLDKLRYLYHFLSFIPIQRPMSMYFPYNVCILCQK